MFNSNSERIILLLYWVTYFHVKIPSKSKLYHLYQVSVSEKSHWRSYISSREWLSFLWVTHHCHRPPYSRIVHRELGYFIFSCYNWDVNFVTFIDLCVYYLPFRVVHCILSWHNWQPRTNLLNKNWMNQGVCNYGIQNRSQTNNC